MKDSSPRIAAHRVVATAGHVDHGKSRLLRALTGMEPDRLEEERRRGLSIELGFVWTDLRDDLTVAFVDVPGHERFIGTMLAGVGAVAGALFVVAADDGWSAQSEEHLEILDLLGTPGVAVAVTKTGVAGPARSGQVAAQVRERLEGTSLADAPVVLTDAVDGHGLAELRAALVSRLEALPAPTGPPRPRLWVDRVFTIAGAGTVVTGTLQGGDLSVGATVTVEPQGTQARIRGLQSLGQPVEAARAGTRLAVNLAGVDRAEIRRGDALAGGGTWYPARTVDVVCRALPGREVARTGAWRLHVGSARTPVEVRPLLGPVESAQQGVVRLRLEHPLPLVPGDRAVLRETGRQATVAGVVVVDTAPPPMPSRGAERADRAAALLDAAAAATAEQRLTAILRAGDGILPREPLLAGLGWRPDTALPEGTVSLGDALVHGDLVAAWHKAVAEVVAAGPAEREGLIAAAAGAGAPPPVADALVDNLVRSGMLQRTEGGRYAAPADADQARARRQERWGRVLMALEATPFAPPDFTDVVRSAGLDHREATAMVQSGVVVRCGSIVFSRRAVDGAIDRLERLEAEAGPFTAAQAKNAWDTTRRYAIPLLEHLDAIGVTTFDGTLRTLTGRRPATGRG